MKTFIQKNLIAVSVGVVVIIVAVGSVWYIAANHSPSFGTITATRGNVIASLNEAGTVMAEDNANLSFQESGQIAQVYATEGQQVSAGTVLASLSSASLQANVQQANAALAAAQANLAQLQAGTRPEQLTIDQTAVTNAQATLSVDIGNAYSSADDAVHNQTDNLFNEPKTNNPTFLVPVNDTQLLNGIVTNRIAIESVLANWYAELNTSSSLVTTAISSLNQIQSYLDQLALAVNDATPNSTMTTSVLAGYKTDVATARTEVGVAITTLTSAQSTLTSAQDTLSLAQAGSTPQQLQAQQAVVAQAQAAATAAQVALNNASLFAPFAGTVQNLTAQVGQVVAPGVSVASLVNNGGLKIEAYASEADVAKITNGEQANVTLDAFGTGMQFSATVGTVDTAETMVNGTPAYLITLHFTNAEPQIKDGMTGNVQIILAEHDNVLEVPSQLVINNDNQYFVLIGGTTGTVEQPVTIGLVGDNDMTEITSGLSEGQTLANF